MLKTENNNNVNEFDVDKQSKISECTDCGHINACCYKNNGGA
jgi:hypothetical protein